MRDLILLEELIEEVKNIIRYKKKSNVNGITERLDGVQYRET